MGRGRSGIGAGKSNGDAGKGSNGIAAALKLAEDRIRGNPTESAIAFDDDGTILFDTSQGEETSVTISPALQMKAYGKTVTHNHPHGYYFSSDDLNVMELMNLKQMRATTPDGRAFVLERKAGYSNIGLLRSAYDGQIISTARKAANIAYDPKLSTEEFNHRAALEHTKILNAWLKDNAPNYGFTFREE